MKSAVLDQQTELDLKLFPLFGKDEINLVDVPFGLLSHRPAAKRNGATIKTIKVQKNYKSITGEIKTGTVVITGSDAYGLPLPADTDLWMSILYLFKTQKFESDIIFFTRYELLSILEWPKTKQYYDRLKAGLNRLKSVNIVFDKCWWNSVHKKYTSTAFNLIDNYELFDERVGGGSEKSYIKLNSVVYDNCRSGYIKSLDLKFYLSLSSSITKQLFRVLDKQCQNKTTYLIGVRKLAHDRLGMPGSYYLSQIKRLLLPALEELQKRGFISKWAFEADNLVVNYSKGISEPEFDRSKSIAGFIADELRDPQSLPFFLKITRSFPEPVIYRLLGELKELEQTTEIKHRAKYFTRMVFNEAQKLGINFKSNV